MLVGDVVEDYEAMVPYQMLLMLGYDVHTVCPGKKAGDMVKTVIHDFERDQTYSEKRGHNFGINYDFDKVNTDDYVGLVVPGDRAPEYLRLNVRVLDIVRAFDADANPLPPSATGRRFLSPPGCSRARPAPAMPPSSPMWWTYQYYISVGKILSLI